MTLRAPRPPPAPSPTRPPFALHASHLGLAMRRERRGLYRGCRGGGLLHAPRPWGFLAASPPRPRPPPPPLRPQPARTRLDSNQAVGVTGDGGEPPILPDDPAPPSLSLFAAFPFAVRRPPSSLACPRVLPSAPQSLAELSPFQAEAF